MEKCEHTIGILYTHYEGGSLVCNNYNHYHPHKEHYNNSYSDLELFKYCPECGIELNLQANTQRQRSDEYLTVFKVSE